MLRGARFCHGFDQPCAKVLDASLSQVTWHFQSPLDSMVMTSAGTAPQHTPTPTLQSSSNRTAILAASTSSSPRRLSRMEFPLGCNEAAVQFSCISIDSWNVASMSSSTTD